MVCAPATGVMVTPKRVVASENRPSSTDGSGRYGFVSSSLMEKLASRCFSDQ